MAVNLSALAGAGQQFFTDTGVPLSGGKLYSYAAGTTTPQATYTTAAGSIAHANPIILDSAGRVSTGEIWLTAGSNYKFVLKTSTDTTIATWDNITGINGTGITSNASNVQYDPAGTGAVSTTVQTKLRETVSVKDFGAVGNSTTDDTTAIQNALNVGGIVNFPPGTYKTGPLTVLSNTTIVLSPNTTLIAKTGYGINDSLLTIEDVSNVTIQGNTGVIQMLKAEYTTGEYRHCVKIYGGTNIFIYDLTCKDSGGDGFVVGGGASQICNNVSLINCIADNNRRNGLSISNAINCLVLGGEYKNSDGTAPQFGIDVEPNALAGYEIQNINIMGVYTTNNTGGGISVVPVQADHAISVNISNWTSYYDGQNGGFLASSGGEGMSAILAGSVNLSNSTITNPQTTGILVQKWGPYAPLLKISNVHVINPGSNPALASVTVLFRTGVLLNIEAAHALTYFQNIEINDTDVFDNRTTVGTFTPYYLRNDGTGLMQNITINNPKGNVWTNSNVQPMLIVGNIKNVRVSYYPEFLVADQATQTLAKHLIGTTISAAANSNFSLPLAADVIGAEYSFVVNKAGLILIVCQGTDVVQNYSATESPSTMISRQLGARITVRAIAANIWQVVNVAGGWGTSNYYGLRYPITLFTAAPISGTWQVGDIIYNYAPTSGGYIGWVCTTAGTPGTWKTFGLIS